MTTKVLTVLLAFTVGTLGMGTLGSAFGQKADCGSDAFSKAVDRAAATLRQHSADTQPRILAGIRQLKVRNGWRDEEEGDRARELLSDAETDALDQRAAQLLATMDRANARRQSRRLYRGGGIAGRPSQTPAARRCRCPANPGDKTNRCSRSDEDRDCPLRRRSRCAACRNDAAAPCPLLPARKIASPR